MHFNSKLIYLSVALLLGLAIASPLDGNYIYPSRNNTYTEQLCQSHEKDVFLLSVVDQTTCSVALPGVQNVTSVRIVSNDGYPVRIRLTPHFE